MNCRRYQVDIELLPSLNGGNAQFQQTICHIRQCPHCLIRYQVARELDEVLEIKLNELDPPAAYPVQVMSYIQYSLMPELRRAILEEVKSTASHPPARWVYQQVKPQFPQTSIRSVCRHLAILKNEGDILELNFGEGFKRFEGNLEPHCHFICQQCRGIYDIFRPAYKPVDLTEIQNMGYQVLIPNLELWGICKRCRTA